MYERMETLAFRLAKNRIERKAAAKEMQTVIVEAYSEGCSVTFIAEALGISRQTVYTALKRV